MTPVNVVRLDRHSLTGMEARPARTLGMKARKRKRERVRRSSLIDWPVYPRLTALCGCRRPCANARRFTALLGPGERQRGHAGLIEIEKRRGRRALLTVHKP